MQEHLAVLVEVDRRLGHGIDVDFDTLDGRGNHIHVDRSIGGANQHQYIFFLQVDYISDHLFIVPPLSVEDDIGTTATTAFARAIDGLDLPTRHTLVLPDVSVNVMNSRASRAFQQVVDVLRVDDYVFGSIGLLQACKGAMDVRWLDGA